MFLFRMNTTQLLEIDRRCNRFKLALFSLAFLAFLAFCLSAFASDSPLSSIEHSSSVPSGAASREVSLGEVNQRTLPVLPKPMVAELPSSIEMTSPLSNPFPPTLSFSGRGFVTSIKMSEPNIPLSAVRTLDDGTKIIYGKLEFIGDASRPVKSNEEILWCQARACSEETFPLIVGVKQLVNSTHPFKSKSVESLRNKSSLDSALPVPLQPILSDVTEVLEGNKVKITATVKAPSYEKVEMVLKNYLVEEVKRIALKQQPGTDFYRVEIPLPRGLYSYGIEVKFEDQILMKSMNRSLTVE